MRRINGNGHGVVVIVTNSRIWDDFYGQTNVFTFRNRDKAHEYLVANGFEIYREVGNSVLYTSYNRTSEYSARIIL